MSKMYKGTPIEEYRALVQDKKKAVLELLKGVNFEQANDILELVTHEVNEKKSQSILL
jgi:hypothetical protein